MSVRIVRLGSKRAEGEGLRLGTVGRVPRGVRKHEYASRDYFDLWLPELAPSLKLLGYANAKGWTDERWEKFASAYQREMHQAGPQRLLALLARLSHETDIAVGCYCEDENRCHRSVLRELFKECDARLAR